MPPSAIHTLLQRLYVWLGGPRLSLRLWTDEEIGASEQSVATFAIQDLAALLRLLADPEMQFGELYMEGRIRLESGDLVAGLVEVFQRQSPAVMETGWYSVVARRLRRHRANTMARARRNIHDHYDLGNDFYRLWLDATLSYTCAYFPTTDTALQDAQIAKLDHVCRKLNLRGGETIIEAGCGWGGFALHAASRYGARVRAFNISHEQITVARERAQRAGLGDRVEFVEDDYRNCRGSCDVFVSIGMLEHVGLENYTEFGRIIRRVLSASGRGLVHSIGRNAPKPLNRWIERRIFPGAFVPSLSEILRIFEPNGLSVLDVENLRLHYARTLQHWATACERARGTIAGMFDERFSRMWQLYLACSQAAFLTGELQLFQVVFAPARNNQLALTRNHVYQANTGVSKWTAATS
jgi:cyclopropane-fatty-acyl-phospholipid synthase